MVVTLDMEYSYVQLPTSFDYSELILIGKDDYPELLDKIMNGLQHMCEFGIPLLLVTIRARIIGLIRAGKPEIIEKVACNGSRFQVSTTWVRKIVDQKLGWTFCKATQNAHKLPESTESQMQISWYCHAVAIFYHNIPAELRVNGDQTQIVLQPPCVSPMTLVVCGRSESSGRMRSEP